MTSESGQENVQIIQKHDVRLVYFYVLFLSFTGTRRKHWRQAFLFSSFCVITEAKISCKTERAAVKTGLSFN